MGDFLKRLLPLGLLLLLPGCAQAPEDTGRLQVVATIFPAYDFARAAAGDLADVTMLLPPGTESHSYEPSPADILKIQDCDLFLYTGGESDTWVETLLDAVEPRGERLRMVDCVDLLEEETVEGMQARHEEEREEEHGLGAVAGKDEHVWTSPKNAAAITRAVGEALASIDGGHAADYRAGAEEYASRLDALDREFADFFAGTADPVMVFGDRFPLRYFAEEYGVTYYAAFPGCSSQTEPSAATVAFLTEKARGLPAVWYIEFSNHLVADSIAEAAGTGTALFHSCHNVSKAGLDAGATYLSLMEENLESLRQYLGGGS